MAHTKPYILRKVTQKAILVNHFFGSSIINDQVFRTKKGNEHKPGYGKGYPL